MPTFTENLYRNLHTGVRIAIAQSNARHAPYACIVSETQYNSYIRDYKSDIMPFLPIVFNVHPFWQNGHVKNYRKKRISYE